MQDLLKGTSVVLKTSLRDASHPSAAVDLGSDGDASLCTADLRETPFSGGKENATAGQKAHWQGLLIAFISHVIWGVSPAYWKLMDGTSSLEILAHRLFWSSVFLLMICLLVCRKTFLALFKDRRALLILLAAGLVCTVTWGIYIYAVTSGYIIQASLGYYINPLVVILIGMVVFKEKLTPAQKIASFLAAIGVVSFTINYGSFPWISLTLAVTFALYGMFKKMGGYSALPALAVETTLVVPLAVIYIAAAFFTSGHAFLAVDASGALTTQGIASALLLAGGGIVTFVPLLLFSDAVNKIPLIWVGFLQYISPTITLVLGIFAYGEAFTFAHALCFGLIWLGLALIVIETAVNQRKRT